MKTLTDHLAQYASYHRDHRNVVTHFIGIPLIVLSISTLLARPTLATVDLPALLGAGGALAITPALIVSLLAGLFYFRLDLRYGLVMALWLGVSYDLGWHLAQASTQLWLSTGIGLFVVGWVAQFIGHFYEGRKPAFVDDLIGLLVGPLFLVAEASFYLGWRRDVFAAVQARVATTH